MNKKLEEFKRDIKSKKVAVLGMGISNTPLVKYLAGLGVDITVFDKSSEEELKDRLGVLRNLNVKYILGKDYLKSLKGFDVIFKTPKIRFDIPEIIRERERGAEITSEMEVFVKLCPAEIFAVTGSDGKTTTTTLIHGILAKHGYRCWLGGNIGTPLLDRIDEVKETDKVVLELSSFQLHTMTQSPHTAVVTNMSPNHLDVHKSIEEYTNAKKNIFKYQRKEDRVVLNYDNDITRVFAAEAPGRVIPFSRLRTLKNGAFLQDGKLVYTDGTSLWEIVETEEVLLPGDHNIENYLAAIAATIDYVKSEDIRDVAVSFKGVEHRMELVRVVNGVSFYNDSIGTSPARTIAGLNAFKQKVILIAGGYDKNIPYDGMGEVLAKKVKHLVLIGPTGPKIAEALNCEMKRAGADTKIPVTFCRTFEETVRTAVENATDGDIVVLSPASASFDLFRDFEERGNRFKELVMAIPENK